MDSESSPIQLIIGLGNPGSAYEQTRHNAGADFVSYLSQKFDISLRQENKFLGFAGDGLMLGKRVRLLIPTTYMNKSGQSASAMASFYQIPVEQVLVAHDELDIPPGSVRLKVGGGHGGHNGLRDLIQAFGNNKNFRRLRFGIGHPGSAIDVTGYALSKPSKHDHELLEDNFNDVERLLADILSGNNAKAMQVLHSQPKPSIE